MRNVPNRPHSAHRPIYLYFIILISDTHFYLVLSPPSSFAIVTYLNFSKRFLKYNKREVQRMRELDHALT